MAGINTAGIAKTSDYLVGRGTVLLALLDEFDIPGEYRDVGNAKTMRITAESETLEHFSSRSVARTKDAEVALETSADVEIVVDEINFDNVATFFLGEATTHTNHAGGWTDGTFGVPNNFLNPERPIGGRWYDLYSSATRKGAGYAGAGVTDVSSNRVYDIDTAADVTIVTTGAVNHVGGVDFDVDLDTGMIFIRETGALIIALDAAVAGLSNATDEYVVLTNANGVVDVELASQTAQVATMDEVQAFSSASKTYALKYIMLNANDNGHVTEVQMHKIKLVPNGDFDLLTEDAFAELTLTGAAENNETADSDSGFITMRTRRN